MLNQFRFGGGAVLIILDGLGQLALAFGQAGACLGDGLLNPSVRHIFQGGLDGAGQVFDFKRDLRQTLFVGQGEAFSGHLRDLFGLLKRSLCTGVLGAHAHNVFDGGVAIFGGHLEPGITFVLKLCYRNVQGAVFGGVCCDGFGATNSGGGNRCAAQGLSYLLVFAGGYTQGFGNRLRRFGLWRGSAVVATTTSSAS